MNEDISQYMAEGVLEGSSEFISIEAAPQKQNAIAKKTSSKEPFSKMKTLYDQLNKTDRWNFICQKKTIQELREIFNHFPTTPNLCYLWLYWNQMTKIVLVINSTSFSHLKTINIGGNLITSLEGLEKLNAPILEDLWLWNNKISSTRNLRRLITSKLKLLDITKNCLAEASKIKEIIFFQMTHFKIDENRFTSIADFLPILLIRREIRIDLLENPLISILNKPAKKDKKYAENFIFDKNEVNYC